MRLVVGGVASRCPSLSSILRAVVRRARILTAFYGREGPELAAPGVLLDAAEDTRILDHELTEVHVPRRSGRTGREMTLHGVTGRVTYSWPRGCPGPQEWLTLGEAIHLGKATTFGFGRIAFTTSPTAAEHTAAPHPP